MPPVKVLRPRPDPDAINRQITDGTELVLMLDYDGTLAPFQADRHLAYPSPWVLPVLQSWMNAPAVHVAIVSGRPADEVAALLRFDPLPDIWGAHGWEVRRSSGQLDRRKPPALARAGLDLAVKAASDAGFSPQIERKAASVAIHWRGLSSGEIARIRHWTAAAWGEIAHNHELLLHPFDGGLELKAGETNKGTAVSQIISESPPNTFAIYAGDDLTDEDAFAVLPDNALGIQVGSATRPTAAHWRLESSEQLQGLLESWLSLRLGTGKISRVTG